MLRNASLEHIDYVLGKWLVYLGNVCVWQQFGDVETYLLHGIALDIIGVYGMGGIDEVIFAEVSQSENTKNIQAEIAEKLGLELHEETESRTASRICGRLKNQRKVLVLDNIWKHLDLENVGIPYGDDHRGRKVLLTTRDRNVLLKMGSKDNFSISVLDAEEAWRLFKQMAGDDIEIQNLKSTAIDVAKACGGLHVAITTIARELRNKSVPERKNVLRELRTPSSGNFEGVPAEAYSTIELSYRYLKSEQLKKTFLLCSLMSYPPSTYRFVQLWDGFGTKLSMHDVVRDVAISIACRDQHAFVVRNEDLWKWPDKNILRKCSAISLTESSIHELPEGLECPQLEFLYMYIKDSFVKFPENFIIGMRKLRVLYLSRMELTSLPSSLDALTNLQTLCLAQGVIEDVAIIGMLKNLEILSFVGSDIVHLPKELGQLTKLKLLDLCNCYKLKVIAPHVISTLTRLEELYMGNCSVDWEVEGFNSGRINASLMS
ncbi:Disease resistance protein [Melia azedarach]|uniref:Disease resistance protein n=1 Tax=Melia azedarach TaxID=155640 RepID=A0ACC1YDP2_MELAZ|nr:Disease resistance protein [Melia azedarach]